MSADRVVCWIFALPFIALFFFVYGIIEQAVQKHRAARKKREAQQVPLSLSPSEPLKQTDLPPENRGYDSPALFRLDALMHIRQLDREVVEHEQNIQSILREIQKRQSGEE